MSTREQDLMTERDELVPGIPPSGIALGEERGGRPIYGVGERLDGAGKSLAKGLGWFSLGLGLAEVLAPRRMARLTGLTESRRDLNLLRLFGLREITSGLGLLAGERPRGWAWSRVAGDALDLAVLGAAFRADRDHRDRAAIAAAAVLGVSILDVIAGVKLGRGREDATDGEPIQRMEGPAFTLSPTPAIAEPSGAFVESETVVISS